MTAAQYRTDLDKRVGHRLDRILNKHSEIAGLFAHGDGLASKRRSRKTSHTCDTDRLLHICFTGIASA